MCVCGCEAAQIWLGAPLEQKSCRSLAAAPMLLEFSSTLSWTPAGLRKRLIGSSGEPAGPAAFRASDRCELSSFQRSSWCWSSPLTPGVHPFTVLPQSWSVLVFVWSAVAAETGCFHGWLLLFGGGRRAEVLVCRGALTLQPMLLLPSRTRTGELAGPEGCSVRCNRGRAERSSPESAGEAGVPEF